MTAEQARHRLLLTNKQAALERYPVARFAGRGIVICAGGASFFTNAYVLLHFLRNELQCRLPIEIWHLGPAEMSVSMQSLLEAFEVRVVDATARRDIDHAWIIDGWQLKAHALAWSSFEEVLLLDADQVPTRDPAEIFEWPQYRETGAVLWPDIVDLIPQNPIWDSCGLSPRAMPAIESGQLVIHKARHWPAMQIALHLNEHADFYYRMIYGDKETYLLALLMAQSTFATVPHRPGGDLGLCLYQHDFEGTVLFQHRTNAKWRYAGIQDELPGFVGLAACSQALSQLRKSWNGLIFHAPERGERARQAEREWGALGTLTFLVAGKSPVRLQLLPHGEIGEGRSAGRMNWWCDEEDGVLQLTICDAFGPCWRFELQPNNRWYGSSVGDPAVAAFAAVDADGDNQEGRNPVNATWRHWPMPGRYSSVDDGDI